MTSSSACIEGCMHGELVKVYSVIQRLQEAEDTKIDLLIYCGDFQIMTVPPPFTVTLAPLINLFLYTNSCSQLKQEDDSSAERSIRTPADDIRRRSLDDEKMEDIGSWDAIEWTKIESLSQSHGLGEFLLVAEEVVAQELKQHSWMSCDLI